MRNTAILCTIHSLLEDTHVPRTIIPNKII